MSSEREANNTFSAACGRSRASEARPGQMLGRDVETAFKFRDGARQLKNPIIQSSGHAQLLHPRAEQTSSGAVHPAELPHLGYTHVRVAGQAAALVSDLLCLYRALAPRPDSIGRLDLGLLQREVAGELGVDQTTM